MSPSEDSPGKDDLGGGGAAAGSQPAGHESAKRIPSSGEIDLYPELGLTGSSGQRPEPFMFAVAIIERELRVRSRRRITSWLRVGVGLAATVIAISNLNWISRTIGAARAGKQMFLMLAWMAFAFCLLEGARCAADVISREKREGTLGFLILTELSGFEVVLGKFTAASVTSFYALLAVFPAMAIALAVGGLTAGEFWRTQIVLLNTLFLGVAAGLWVSARSDDDTRSLLGTVGLLFGILLVPLFLGLFPTLNSWFIPSPGLAMSLADATNYTGAPVRFWGSLLTVHAVAWMLLLMAGWNTSSSWRTEPGCSAPATSENLADERGCTLPPPLRSHPELALRELLDRRPVRWLVERRREGQSLIWVAVLLQPTFYLGFNLFIARLMLSSTSAGTLSAAFFAAGLTAHLILATAASRRIAEDAASGALEMLLSSPLSSPEIVMGYGWGLWRRLRWPLLTASVVPFLVQLVVGYPRWVGMTSNVSFYFVVQLVTFLIYPAHWLAVCWLALWLGARSRSAARAVGLTVAWTMLVPYLGQSLFGLVVSFIGPMNASTQPSNWMYLVSFLHLFGGLTYSVGVIFWARHRLLKGLRDRVIANRSSEI